MKICVYAASGDDLKQEYFRAAYELGALIAGHGHTLVFGGGTGGLMGETARGAHDASGEIIGIAPKFFDEPGVLYKECSDFIFTETVRERKGLMEDMADAFIVLPGGIGTFEEFFETLTLKQLGAHGKPIAILNTLGYYTALDALLRQMADDGFMSKNCLMLYSLRDTPAAAVEHAETEKPLSGSVRRLRDYAK